MRFMGVLLPITVHCRCFHQLQSLIDDLVLFLTVHIRLLYQQLLNTKILGIVCQELIFKGEVDRVSGSYQIISYHLISDKNDTDSKDHMVGSFLRRSSLRSLGVTLPFLSPLAILGCMEFALF